MRDRTSVMACADQLAVLSSGVKPGKKASLNCGPKNASPTAKLKEGPMRDKCSKEKERKGDCVRLRILSSRWVGKYL